MCGSTMAARCCDIFSTAPLTGIRRSYGLAEPPHHGAPDLLHLYLQAPPEGVPLSLLVDEGDEAVGMGGAVSGLQCSSAQACSLWLQLSPADGVGQSLPQIGWTGLSGTWLCGPERHIFQPGCRRACTCIQVTQITTVMPRIEVQGAGNSQALNSFPWCTPCSFPRLAGGPQGFPVHFFF